MMSYLKDPWLLAAVLGLTAIALVSGLLAAVWFGLQRATQRVSEQLAARERAHEAHPPIASAQSGAPEPAVGTSSQGTQTAPPASALQQFDQLVEGIGGYGGQCATPPHVLAPTTAFSDQITAMRKRIAGLESFIGFLVGGPFARNERHQHLDEIVDAILAVGGHRAAVFDLLRQVIGLRDLDAWAASRKPLEVTDGDLTLRAYWSAEDGCWWAQLTDAQSKARQVQYAPLSHGSTCVDALAHLAVATYVGLIEDRVSEATIEAVARNFVTEFATQCGDLDTFLTLADRMALVRAGMALAIGTEPATHATPPAPVLRRDIPDSDGGL